MRYTGTFTLLALTIFMMISTNPVYSEESQSHYKRIIEKIDSLEKISLDHHLKKDLDHNWDTISQSQKHEIEDMIDDITLLESVYHQKSYPEIENSFDRFRFSLNQTKTITDLTDHTNQIDEIESAISVLISRNEINHTLKNNPISDSQTYLNDIWEPVQNQLERSTTTDNVLALREDIDKIKVIVQYNSEIHENTHSPVFVMIDPHIKSIWSSFKSEIEKSSLLDDMKTVATKYHQNMRVVDDEIISKWEDKVITLQKEAHKQNNNSEIISIEQNIKNLNMVKNIESSKSYFDDDSQTKAILLNISGNYLKIKSEIKEYDLYLDKKGQMEQKVIELQNKVNDQSSIERMPEFEPKIKNTLKRVSSIQNALESNDFRYAQQLLNGVEQEWINFERFYPEIRNYTPIYKQQNITTGEKKQIYLEQILDIDNLVRSMGVNQTSADYEKYQKSLQESKVSILYGNFHTGHDKIYQTIDLINQLFLLDDPQIMMNVDYAIGTHILTVNGAVYKHSMNSRDRVSLNIFNADGQIVEVDTHTTRHGEYQILWRGDMKPGLYVAEIYHGPTSKESQIISITDGTQKMVFTQDELAVIEIANIFESLEGFVEKFSGSTSDRQFLKMQLLINKIKEDLTDGDIGPATESIQKFKNNIKLYLPVQSPQIVIDSAVTSDGIIKITGKVQKLVEHREPVFLSVFDQHGKKIHEQLSHDDKYGNINLEIPKRIISGFAVIQIEYHDYLARDIIEITSIPT